MISSPNLQPSKKPVHDEGDNGVLMDYLIRESQLSLGIELQEHPLFGVVTREDMHHALGLILLVSSGSMIRTVSENPAQATDRRCAAEGS